MFQLCYSTTDETFRSTQIRLAAAEEVMQAKAYMCFVSECRTNRCRQLTLPHGLSTRNASSCIARCTLHPISYIRSQAQSHHPSQG